MLRAGILAEKRILVTGGGSGLGREMALAFAAAGAKVHICGRRANALDETMARYDGTGGGQIVAHVSDIRDPQSIESMVDEIWASGPLTGLLNNAAANFVAQTKDLSARAFDAVTSTVMNGTFYCTNAVGKRWISEGLPGSIVSTLVTWVWTGSPFVVPSTMAKTALHGMTMSLAVEWARHGIRVNAVAPGPFPTDEAWEKLNPMGASTGAASDRFVPMRRFGRIDELANLLMFLYADGCDYLTGATIPIDGGHHLAAPSTFADMLELEDADWDAMRAKIRSASERQKQDRNIG
jgi:NAD(P)-dependent dehydrogenase (short-subunit alcohol dehydrogenase family)